MYRNTEIAFGDLDFSGLGYVTMQAFLSSQLVKSLNFSNEHLQLYFKEYNLFPSNTPGMNSDDFKKNFFPHLYLVQEEPDDADEEEALKNRESIINNIDNQPLLIQERLANLEKKLKIKF